MWCCSRKTLYILLAAAGIFGLLIATGKINGYALLPFLPFLICPLMCIPMLMMGRKGKDGECGIDHKKPSTPEHHVEK